MQSNTVMIDPKFYEKTLCEAKHIQLKNKAKHTE